MYKKDFYRKLAKETSIPEYKVRSLIQAHDRLIRKCLFNGDDVNIASVGRISPTYIEGGRKYHDINKGGFGITKDKVVLRFKAFRQTNLDLTKSWGFDDE